ncbi:hypothetical protein GCM10007424_11720 [Flavobacterium suaedae]|uniref:SMI1/KNR4 family protein n=1 Tax=Flavobacterium suaedae TaxID=1767027 RepID=A0ABQ1JRC2_9FLAO|nr:hypothetical protein [Flavobacterium suaedae]GGB73461.1 hypothetical protein GCM10007424_11720 [Flavobacterium suaedae]
MEKQHQLLSQYIFYEEETFEEFLQRYEGYGKALYFEIKRKLPHIYKHLTFLKAVDRKPNYYWTIDTEDSYCIFDDGNKTVCMALDYYGVICIWNYDGIRYETGDWDEELEEKAVAKAIDYIEKNF